MPARPFGAWPPSPESGSSSRPCAFIGANAPVLVRLPAACFPPIPYIVNAIPSILCTLRTRPHRCLSPSSLIFFFSSIVPALPLPLPVCRRVRARSRVCKLAAIMLARVASASQAHARAYTHPRAPTVVSVSIPVSVSVSVSVSVLPIPHPCILFSPPFVPTLAACPSVCATSCAAYCLDPALHSPALMPLRIPMQGSCPSTSPCPHYPASPARVHSVYPLLMYPRPSQHLFHSDLNYAHRVLFRLFHFNLFTVLVLFAVRYSLSATRPPPSPTHPVQPVPAPEPSPLEINAEPNPSRSSFAPFFILNRAHFKSPPVLTSARRER
ncbi:hypothetical protein DFH09DRAFT_1322351 [Mycena vulgaris]|nr:hypothetical protein DFH09DRAFT_1322351 [Mycena vulgaris]